MLHVMCYCVHALESYYLIYHYLVLACLDEVLFVSGAMFVHCN
jgi:hypothetical protein